VVSSNTVTLPTAFGARPILTLDRALLHEQPKRKLGRLGDGLDQPLRVFQPDRSSPFELALTDAKRPQRAAGGCSRGCLPARADRRGGSRRAEKGVSIPPGRATVANRDRMRARSPCASPYVRQPQTVAGLEAASRRRSCDEAMYRSGPQRGAASLASADDHAPRR